MTYVEDLVDACSGTDFQVKNGKIPLYQIQLILMDFFLGFKCQ